MKSVHFDYNFLQTKDRELQVEFHHFLLSQFTLYSSSLSSWHDELCYELSPKIKHWWYASGSRLIAWQPPIYQPLYYALAIKEFSQTHQIKNIKITNAPRILKTYLEEIDTLVTYDLEYDGTKESSLKEKLKLLLAPYWELLKLFRDALIYSKRLNLKENYQLVINSQFWGLAHFLKGGDHFFGKMLNSPPFHKNILWIYNPSRKINEEEKEKMAQILSGKDVIFLEDYWTISDALHITLNYFNYKWETMWQAKNMTVLRIKGSACNKFSLFFIRTMIIKSHPITELKIERFFNKLHQKTKVKKIIFPFEDKGLERAIILSTGSRSQTYGYAHAVHNPGHLYLDKRPENKGYPPRPDKIICSGEAAAQWVRKKTNLGPDRILAGGSNRYREVALPLLKQWKPTKILFLSGQSYEVRMLANWVSESPRLFDGFKLTVRKYPYDELIDQERGIEAIQKHCQVFQTSESLFEQIDAADIVFFTSSSSGFEALMGRRLVIYAHLHHIVPLDPVIGRGDSKSILSATNSKEFEKILKRIQTLSVDEVKDLIEQQKKFAFSIYGKPNINFLWED